MPRNYISKKMGQKITIPEVPITVQIGHYNRLGDEECTDFIGIDDVESAVNELRKYKFSTIQIVINLNNTNAAAFPADLETKDPYAGMIMENPFGGRAILEKLFIVGRFHGGDSKQKTMVLRMIIAFIGKIGLRFTKDFKISQMFDYGVDERYIENVIGSVRIGESK